MTPAEPALKNLGKVLWPTTGFTKGDLIEYYRGVAPALLPHLRGRPVTLARFPDGIEGPGWYQANCRGSPEWMRIAEVRARDGSVLRYCLVEDVRSLLWVVNLGTIELHPLHHLVDRPEFATAVVLDLDPGEPAGVVDCCRVALDLRDALEAHGLRAFPKTSGSRGLHLLVALEAEMSHAEAKSLARTLATSLARRDPDRVTDRIERRARTGRVLVDWGQNDPTRSTIAPYSLRATRTPQVSTPLRWEEVERARDPAELRFGPEDVLGRIERWGDLFAEVSPMPQGISG